MAEGLFRSELEAVFHRYGYLLWRRCARGTTSRAEAELRFRKVFSRVAEVGAELRGLEDKLAWLDRIVSEGSQAPTPKRELELEALHVGDPSPRTRAEIKADPELSARFAELDRAKAEFGEMMDLPSVLSEIFRDEPIVVLRPRRGFGLFVGALALLLVSTAVLWPEEETPGIVPEAFGLTVLIEREGRQLRELGPEIALLGGDRLRVEVAVPKKQTLSVLLVEKDGSLTPLAIGRLFRPGIFMLPQTLHVDERAPLVAELFAGPPALVRTATSGGSRDGVLTVALQFGSTSASITSPRAPPTSKR